LERSSSCIPERRHATKAIPSAFFQEGVEEIESSYCASIPIQLEYIMIEHNSSVLSRPQYLPLSPIEKQPVEVLFSVPISLSSDEP
jgi:hypothetical protein